MNAESQLLLGFVLRTALVAAAVYVSAMSAMLLQLATAPAAAARVRRQLAARREMDTLWGLSFVLAIVLAVLLLSRLGPTGFIAGLAFGAGGMAVALMGFACLSVDLGHKIMRLHGGRESTDLVAFLVGGSVMCWSSLVPVLGWVLLSYFICCGCGAVLRSHAAAIRARHTNPASGRASGRIR